MCVRLRVLHSLAHCSVRAIEWETERENKRVNKDKIISVPVCVLAFVELNTTRIAAKSAIIIIFRVPPCDVHWSTAAAAIFAVAAPGNGIVCQNQYS